MIYTWHVHVHGTLMASGQSERLVHAHHELVTALRAHGRHDAEGMLTYGVDQSRVRIRMTLVPGGVRATDPP